MATTQQRKKRAVKIHIRWMLRRDMPGVIWADNAAGGGWTEAEALDALRVRMTVGMVAVDQATSTQILGYVIYDLNRDHIDVRRLFVHPDYQGKGVGAALVAKMFDKVVSHRRPAIGFRLADGRVWAPTIDPSWRSETVRLMTAADAPPDLAVLADALQESGCEDDVLLGVFRRGGRIGAVVYGALREWMATGVSEWERRARERWLGPWEDEGEHQGEG